MAVLNEASHGQGSARLCKAQQWHGCALPGTASAQLSPAPQEPSFATESAATAGRSKASQSAGKGQRQRWPLLDSALAMQIEAGRWHGLATLSMAAEKRRNGSLCFGEDLHRLALQWQCTEKHSSGNAKLYSAQRRQVLGTPSPRQRMAKHDWAMAMRSDSMQSGGEAERCKAPLDNGMARPCGAEHGLSKARRSRAKAGSGDAMQSSGRDRRRKAARGQSKAGHREAMARWSAATHEHSFPERSDG